MKEQDEKYISIEYKTWVEKYLPMQEENERLRRELSNGHISISLYDYDSPFRGEYGRRIADFSVRGGEIQGFDYASFITILKANISSRYLTMNEYRKEQQKIQDSIDKIEKLPWLVRWIFKIK